MSSIDYKDDNYLAALSGKGIITSAANTILLLSKNLHHFLDIEVSVKGAFSQ